MPEVNQVSPGEGEEIKKKAAAKSVTAAVFLTVLKLVVGIATNSLGVLSEALHSALDLLAAGMTWFAVKVASIPADKSHPYGHGKIENLSALIETLLLVVTCFWITWEAVSRLFFNPVVVKPSVWAILVMIVSIVVDYSRSRMLMRVAKEHRSQALEADALHFSTDMLSSAVVLIGLAALYVGELMPSSSVLRPWLEKADALAALGVSLIILKVSWSLGTRAVNILLDAGDVEFSRDVRSTLQCLPGVRSIVSLRIRHSGPDLFVDLELAVDGNLVLDEVEHIKAEVERRIQEKADHARVFVVTIPFEQGEPDRIMRLRGLAAAHGLIIHAVNVLDLEIPNETSQENPIGDEAGEKVLVELHAEFPPDTPLEEAFQKVSTFEKEFVKTRPKTVMFSHIEPCGASGCETMESVIESRDVMEAVSRIVAEEPGIQQPHSILVRSFGNGRRVGFHCTMDYAASVEEAHVIATRIQKRIHKQVPHLDKVTVQMEPCLDGDTRQP